MSGQGMTSYQDIIELVSDDERTLTSRLRAPDGAWRQVVSVRYRRRRQ
jgi:hypothetical protein